MGIDYDLSQYIGFKINNDIISNELKIKLKKYIDLNLIYYIKTFTKEKYFVLDNYKIEIMSGRLNQFLSKDELTGEIIYPKEYIKNISENNFQNISLNDNELELCKLLNEHNIELEYYEYSNISY